MLRWIFFKKNLICVLNDFIIIFERVDVHIEL